MTTNHMSTEQAKHQGLPGSDVFRFSHLLYHDPLNRDAGVVHLNVEAYKSFSDTVLLTQRHALAAEQRAAKEWLAAGGFASNIAFPWGTATHAYMEYVNYENLKIASGFELHLKARLLSRDFVIHEIDGRNPDYKSLAKEQEARPISKTELFAIRSYKFDGQQNYLPGLKDASLKFAKFTDEAEYRKSLDLPDGHLDIIKDYRTLRNQIHLPGDIVQSPNIQAYRGPIVDFIVGFVNAEIVAYSNALIEKYQLNRSPLVPFL
jgi:hypothetical protein